MARKFPKAAMKMAASGGPSGGSGSRGRKMAEDDAVNPLSGRPFWDQKAQKKVQRYFDANGGAVSRTTKPTLPKVLGGK